MRSEREAAFPQAVPHRAVIDIGSNTVRLVVYGGAPRAPTVLLNEKVVARLGGELQKTGNISQTAMDVALTALKRYHRILADLQVTRVDVIATAAARLAKNGPAFLARVKECGFEPALLSGEQEARTSAMGVIGAFPRAEGVVVDLGGASLELVEIRKGQCTHGVSLPLGALMLPGLRAGGAEKFKRHVNRALNNEGWAHPVNQPLYLVGGTWRALAGFAMAEVDHPLTDPHGFQLNGADALRLAKHVRLTKPKKLNVPRISAMRAAMLPDAATLLQVLIDKLKPSKLVFSSWGLREGRLFEGLDPSAKMQDPLLAGVASFAGPRGGPATLAALIAGWTVNALPREGRGSERVRLAATMLALASVQVEPNLRLKQAINWALHKRWLDIDDEGRVMIAAALSAHSGNFDLPKTLFRLASREAIDEAILWGLGIRLARRLGGGSRNSLRNSALVRADGALVLYLGESHAELRAEHVETDLAALAGRLGLRAAIEIVPNDGLLTRTSFEETRPAILQNGG